MGEIKINKTTDVGDHFDEAKHQYTRDGVPKSSATQWLSQFYSEFDSEKLVRIVAKYQKVNHIQLKKLWKAKGTKGRAFGDYIHSMAEIYYLACKEMDTSIEQGEESPHAIVVQNLMKKLKETYEILEMEVWRIAYIYELGFTPDLVLRHKITGQIIIADFKTTKFTDNESYKLVKNKNAKLMKEPFRALGMREVPLDKATIQLSLYAVLMSEEPSITYMQPEDLANIPRWVIHIPQNIDKYENGYEIFNLPIIDDVVLNALSEFI